MTDHEPTAPTDGCRLSAKASSIPVLLETGQKAAVTVTFANDGEGVKCQRLVASFAAGTGAGDIATTDDLDLATVHHPKKWSVVRNKPTGRYEFVFKPAASDAQTIPKGASVSFNITGIAVNTTPGSTEAALRERLGTDSADRECHRHTFHKATGSFRVTDFHPKQVVVPAGSTAELAWQTTGDTKAGTIRLYRPAQADGIDVTGRHDIGVTIHRDTTFVLTATPKQPTPPAPYSYTADVFVTEPHLTAEQLTVLGTCGLLYRSRTQDLGLRADAPNGSHVSRYRAETDGLLLATVRTDHDATSIELVVTVTSARAKGATHTYELFVHGTGPADTEDPGRQLAVLVPHHSTVRVTWRVTGQARWKQGDSVARRFDTTLRWHPWGTGPLTPTVPAGAAGPQSNGAPS